ncbi:MAG: MgtC/SapB family protein [Alphaproteobacteria bacterium]
MQTVLDPAEIAIRLVAAAVAGVILGVTRDLKRKPTGMRTLALVCLGAALATVSTVYLAPIQADPDATSRVVQGVLQGVLTGVAFLGAGSIIRSDKPNGHQIGLTTAANVMVVAAVGIACGLGQWWAAGLAVTIALFVLVVLGPLEKWLERRGKSAKAEPDNSDA